MSNATTVRVTTEYDATELWSMIMGASWEQWEWWIDYEYRGGDWDKPCTLVITAWGDDQGEDQENYVTKEVTIDDVVLALEALVGIRIVRQHLSKQDFDAVSSDCVLQQCVYGEVVYG